MVGEGERPAGRPCRMVVLAGGAGARRRRAWRWAMRAAASAVVWTAVVQLASIAGLFRPRVLADCGGGGAGGGASAGLAALAGEDSVAVRLSPRVLVPKSKCFDSCSCACSLFAFLVSGDLEERGTAGLGRIASQMRQLGGTFAGDSTRSWALMGGFKTKFGHLIGISIRLVPQCFEFTIAFVIICLCIVQLILWWPQTFCKFDRMQMLYLVASSVQLIPWKCQTIWWLPCFITNIKPVQNI